MAEFPPLFLLRHGQTEWNAIRRIQGQMESQLTEMGKEHAARQGDILARIDLPEEIKAWCSPQVRTRQTAEIALGVVGLAPVFDDRLKEVSLGSWEGRMWEDVLTDKASGLRGASIFQACLMSDGESEADMRARIGDFVAGLSGPTLVVSHGIALTFLRGIVLGSSFNEMDAMVREQGVVLELRDRREVTHR
ncbi:histidine phosphatase family protein [Alisedimentitalea sp. MJ-SS2]|uniref:histidine phosphatase family protein n=1 Tax=Aliisedimentitalea sp. MJ-SS2 TaxID=3049795 RepID=UPI0029072F90|nr:histidine phosphatase family protein [Alisedimentitalea sp. MJ-SS2]MDU8926723.1 histidine phosphatase family protein [Alisedimentitalea sp. MJ-SS2]